MPTVFIGLGTNLGDRAENLSTARTLLAAPVRLTAESTVIETAPWGYSDQPDFLNQVVRGETLLPPLELLEGLKSIEAHMGREPTFRYGPRLIDLDLLYYADLIQAGPGLTLPHPRLHEREFVLGPLAEIAPDWTHPVMGKTHRELVAQMHHQENQKAGDGELQP